MCDTETDQPAIGGSRDGGRAEQSGCPPPQLHGYMDTNFPLFHAFFGKIIHVVPPAPPRVSAFLRKILNPPLVWSMATVVLPRSIFVLMHCSNLYFQNILNKFQTILSTIPAGH